MPKRVEYLDIARGIGILLVVLGHNDFAALSPFFQQVIYSFHIPSVLLSCPGHLSQRLYIVLRIFQETFSHGFEALFVHHTVLIYFVSVSFEKMGFQIALLRIAKALYGSIDYIDWAQLWFLPNLFVVSLYAFYLYSDDQQIAKSLGAVGNSARHIGSFPSASACVLSIFPVGSWKRISTLWAALQLRSTLVERFLSYPAGMKSGSSLQRKHSTPFSF